MKQLILMLNIFFRVNILQTQFRYRVTYRIGNKLIGWAER